MRGIFSFVVVVSVQAVLALPIPQRRAQTVDFAGDPTIDAQAIFTAAQSGKDSLANFSSGPGGSNVDIFGNWLDLIPGNPVFHFTADMDVDCDGVDVRSPNLQSLSEYS